MKRQGVVLTMMFTAGSTASSLPPCPGSPNCVSTQATDKHAIAPLRYTSTQGEAMRRLLAVLRAIPRTIVVDSGQSSVRVEFRTPIFRFVDDTQFLFDDQAKTIHFRSASRIGYSDMGVNRRRMEEIRKAFEATEHASAGKDHAGPPGVP
jgi:uncharacterized protein (DUF1499 family)